MKDKLFIPKKCKVGFNLRSDTYTGKLGYIIYHDGKVWRKEGSWESWREKYMEPEEYNIQKQTAFDASVAQQTKYFNEIVADLEKGADSRYKGNDYYTKIVNKGLPAYLKEREVHDINKYRFYNGKNTSDKGIIPVEFDNVPTEGFVLNKKAGGGGSSHGWDARQTYCRVWDPRGFEFEISIPNLLFILQETNSLKGKGLEGEFVYSWDGKDLVLIPVSCQEYKSSSIHTTLQSGKVAAKELVAGYSYQTKQQAILIYLGKFEYFENYSYGDKVKLSKKFVFADTKGGYVGLDSLASLSKVTNETVISTYAELIDKYSKSDYCGTAKGIKLVPTTFGPKSHNRNSYNSYNPDTAYCIAYKEEKPNVYRRYNFYPETQETRDNNGYYRRNYAATGFQIKPIAELTFADGRVTEKKLTIDKTDTIPLAMTNKLGFGTLSLVLNSGKQVNLY